MKTIRWCMAVGLAVFAACFAAGCMEQDTNKREVRVYNESGGPVHVVIDGAEAMVVAAGKHDGQEIGDGLHTVRLNADDGHKIWEQTISLSAGQYAKFRVEADGTVVGSGGLTYDPTSTGNYPYSYPVDHDQDPRLYVSNHRDQPVHIWIDGQEKAVIAPGDIRSIEPGNGKHLVEFRSSDNRNLFGEMINFRDGQYLHFSIEHDGSVIASGDSILPVYP